MEAEEKKAKRMPTVMREPAYTQEGWKIRYFAMETKILLPGKKVIISPDWVKKFRWDNKEVVIDHTKKERKGSLEFDPNESLDRKYEQVLYDLYVNPSYWD